MDVFSSNRERQNVEEGGLHRSGYRVLYLRSTNRAASFGQERKGSVSSRGAKVTGTLVGFLPGGGLGFGLVRG